eukprot:259065-Hanusia_phi.AAC.1
MTRRGARASRLGGLKGLGNFSKESRHGGSALSLSPPWQWGGPIRVYLATASDQAALRPVAQAPRC